MCVCERTVKEHLIDAMLLSSTSRKAIIYTCVLLLETATSESGMSGLSGDVSNKKSIEQVEREHTAAS